MKKRIIALAIAVLPAMMITSCSKDEQKDVPIKKEEVKEKVVKEKAVVDNYANIVLQNYTDALNDAKELNKAIDAFVKNPSEKSMQKAKDAWLKSRESYGPSEAFRFASGPIDDEDGPEGLLNSWPLDENVIDYVSTDPNSGIINDTAKYPKITKEVLVGTNQVASEESVTTGYHAIEFLLWGQDLTAPADGKAGMRKYTDYTTKSNATRRGKFLTLASELIIEDLQGLINDWKKGGSYYNEFMGLNTKKALGQMITGIAVLSKAELAGERMYVALKNQSQEDEHSCFSDNTHRDIRLNFDGIWNVYFGTYGEIKGASIADLVKQKDAKVAMNVEKAIKDAKEKVYATDTPFDIAISEGKDSAQGKKVLAAVVALQKLGDELVVAAKAIGVDAKSKEEE